MLQRRDCDTVTSKRFVTSVKKNYWLYIFLIPFLLWYVIFAYKPLLGLIIAFKKYSLYSGIANSPFVGLQNFKKFFSGMYFARTFKNTIIMSLMNIIFAFPFSILFAIMLNEVRTKAYKKTVQTIAYLPYFISIVVVAGMVANFLAPTNGVVNIILSKMGFEKIYFLTKKEYFKWIYLIMNMWKNTGYNAIVYIAALAGVNTELYEACKIDGGNKFQQIIHVTIPGILPTIVIMLILQIGTFMEVGYEAIILLYQPVTYQTADVISTYVYRTGVVEGHYDVAAAVGMFNSFIGMALVIVTNYISKKVTETSLW